jgi:hypothetical protein
VPFLTMCREAQLGQAISSKHTLQRVACSSRYHKFSITTATAMSCLQNAVRGAGGNTSKFLSSAWRPSAYQAHLGEVYNKWQKLKGKSIAGCEALKSEVKQEIDKHRIVAKPASPTGKHTTGDAFDVNLDTLGIPASKVDELAKGCNLYRRIPKTDRVHFELITGTPQAPSFVENLLDEISLVEAASDLVRVKVYQQNLGGRVFYRYSVINNSGQAVVGLRIGLNQIEANSELTDVPLGWGDNGLPLNSAEAPAGWEAYVVTTEESDLVSMAWDINQASGSIASGQTRGGFSVILPQANDPYRVAHWTAILDDATTVSGTLEPDTIPSSNPIDIPQTFVTQHYDDFPNRIPDSSGLSFWTNQITSCGTNAQCAEVRRINVSAAFFVSIEFQETGYLVYRMYKAAYGDATSPGVPGTVPIIRLEEFLPDTQKIGQGVQVNVGNWQQQLENNKNAFALEFVQRPRFTSAYPSSMTPTDFVNKLNQQAGGVLSVSERTQLINELSAKNTTEGRASIFRKVAEDADLSRNEFNRAFVLMQYYGYLQRNPDTAPDSNFGGWKFWLDKLNQFNGNYINAEMVKAFISSAEYRQRFGQ